MNEYLDTLSWFNTSWQNHPKNRIFTAKIDSRDGYAAAFETGDLQVLLGIFKGPKGGITSLLMIVDPSQLIEVDRLVCCNCSIGSTRWISSMAHHEVNRENGDFSDVASRLILYTMTEWKNNPELARSEADMIGFGKTSISAFSGGSVSPR
jgi:hypothetical protein